MIFILLNWSFVLWCYFQLNNLVEKNAVNVDWRCSFYLNLIAHSSFSVTVLICRYPFHPLIAKTCCCPLVMLNLLRFMWSWAYICFLGLICTCLDSELSDGINSRFCFFFKEGVWFLITVELQPAKLNPDNFFTSLSWLHN